MKNTFSKTLLGSALALALPATTALANGSDIERVIVKFKDGSGPSIQSLVRSSGGRIERDLSANHGAFAISIPQHALRGLENNPNVEYVEEDVRRQLLSTEQVPYGIPMVQADQLSDSMAGNRTVCIIDSGYEAIHEDLSANNVLGTNDSGTGNWYEDQNGHGTHVAGTIAGIANTVGVVGVMPNTNVNLHIVKVFNADGWGYSSSLVAALDVCEANGANVINMSLGGSRASRTEENAFTNAYGRGVLSIAAAGNDGNTRHSYPASYDAVMSVAAIDETKTIASFSQQTDQVEIAAPGVGVVSSVPTGTGLSTTFTANGTGYESAAMEGAPQGTVTSSLADCGIGDSACVGASGQICLIERGVISFAEKVQACEAGGGIGAVIFNNEPGMLYGTMGEVATSIPSIGIDQADGQALVGSGASATVSIAADNYAPFDGTSMATPHVAGVAALVWSHHTACSAGEVRNALNVTAEDLGAAGRDNAYGNGLVQALAAHEYLLANPCTGDNGGGDNGGGDNSCKGGPRKCG